MNILFLNWRDIKNPKAGGAEVASHENAKRWVKAGHTVTFFTATFPGAKFLEEVDGITVIRFGGQVTVRVHALSYYWRHRREFDLVVDEVNTIPFFTPLYVRKPIVAYFNQLCRRVWFYESSFPLSVIGYLLEPLYLQLYRNTKAMVISDSTKKDLLHFGMKAHNVDIFSMAIDFKPCKVMPTKEKQPTIICVSRLTPSKRIHDMLQAFAIVHQKHRDAKFWIIGRGEAEYKKQLEAIIEREQLQDAITFWGFVDQKKKRDLMGRAHVIMVASIKEGWGLIVTEANACGTVAAVYDVDGLRDSTITNKTGLVTSDNTPQALAQAIMKLLTDKKLYARLQKAGHIWSGQLTWDRSATETLAILEKVARSP